MKLYILIFALLAPLTSPKAESPIAQVTLCHEDISVFPWLTTDRNGLLDFQIKLIEKTSNIKITLIPLPWKRCQLKAKMGEINGVLSASHTPERVTWSQYPNKADGKVDRDFRLHTDSYLVFVNKSSNIKWENKLFKNLGTNPVGVQLGYSVQETLTRMNIPVYTSFSTSLELLKAMSNNFIHAAVLQNFSTKKELNEYPEIAKNIKSIDEPFQVVDQYIAFNKYFYSQNKDIANKIWEATRSSRQNPLYIERFNSLVK